MVSVEDVNRAMISMNEATKNREDAYANFLRTGKSEDLKTYETMQFRERIATTEFEKRRTAFHDRLNLAEDKRLRPHRYKKSSLSRRMAEILAQCDAVLPPA